mgnify:FL=1
MKKIDLFTWIGKESDKLTKKANKYLSKLPEISNQDVADKLAKISFKLFKEAKEDWRAIPWWAGDIMDGHMPYWGVPRNGSLHYSLGFSMSSQEAHLRNLLEIAEGRESKELDFSLICDLDDYPFK